MQRPLCERGVRAVVGRGSAGCRAIATTNGALKVPLFTPGVGSYPLPLSRLLYSRMTRHSGLRLVIAGQRYDGSGGRVK